MHFVPEAMDTGEWPSYKEAVKVPRRQHGMLCSPDPECLGPSVAWLDGASPAQVWASSLLNPSSRIETGSKVMAGVHCYEIHEGCLGQMFRGAYWLGNIEIKIRWDRGGKGKRLSCRLLLVASFTASLGHTPSRSSKTKSSEWTFSRWKCVWSNKKTGHSYFSVNPDMWLYHS